MWSPVDCGAERGVFLVKYLEGLGDLVSRLITPITHIVTPVIPLIALNKSPGPQVEGI